MNCKDVLLQLFKVGSLEDGGDGCLYEVTRLLPKVREIQSARGTKCSVKKSR